MRKWFYAGAVAGGFLLLGAAPAQADVVPAPAGGLLSALGGDTDRGLGLDPAGGLNLASPLDGSPLMDVQPGQNSADVSSPATDTLTDEDDKIRTRQVDEATGRRSGPADRAVLGGLTRGTSASGQNRGTGGSGGALGNLVPADLLGGGLLGGGLTPDGRMATTEAPRESALFDGGVPLLGGLGGLLPANETPRTLPATDDDTPNGMPAGGTPVDPATVDPQAGKNDKDGKGKDGKGHGHKGKDQVTDPAVDEPVDDPRLHEEPIDDEAGGKKRTFSDGGRPIAGEDEDFR